MPTAQTHILSNPHRADPGWYVPRFVSVNTTMVPGGEWHTFCQRFWVLDTANTESVRLRVAGQEFLRAPHTVALYPPKTPYAEYSEKSFLSHHAWIMFEVKRRSSPLHPLVKENRFRFFRDPTSSIKTLVHHLANSFEKKAPAFAIWADFYQILALLESASNDPVATIHGLHPAPPTSNSALPALVEKEILAHLGESFTAEQMAQRLGLNLSTFSHRYPKESGESFVKTRARLRIQKAKEMLLLDDTMIKVLAIDLGFADTAHFSRVFTQMVGMSPAAFRGEFAARAPRNRTPSSASPLA